MSAQDYNAVTPVRLEPGALRSRIKHSTTEPLRSHGPVYFIKYFVCFKFLFTIRNVEMCWHDRQTNQITIQGMEIPGLTFMLNDAGNSLVPQYTMKHTYSKQ